MWLPRTKAYSIKTCEAAAKATIHFLVVSGMLGGTVRRDEFVFLQELNEIINQDKEARQAV